MAAKQNQKVPINNNTSRETQSKVNILNKQKYELEVKRLERNETWDVSYWGKLLKLSPIFTPCVLFLSLIVSILVYRNQSNRLNKFVM